MCLVVCLLALLVQVSTAVSSDSAEHRYTNRLIDSSNPYLLLHAHNPVDWYPWGAEAFEKAKRDNKPIFLSIGYSTCYWCHVAERTLFSNPEIAKLMNEWFVSIKVDREERPDVDAVYLLATQLITSGSAGWPNNVFLTPDLAPFYAGGTFPAEDDELGRPGFPSVLAAIHEEWTQQPQRVQQRAKGVVDVLRKHRMKATTDSRAAIDPKRWMDSTRAALLNRFDAEQGGLGAARLATKFPQSPALRLMLLDYEMSHDPRTLHFITVTLDAMAYGGIYDQVGGGFHRYAIERTWSIPHFEKMLYDNAQLLAIYARAWKLTRKPQYRRIALGVRDYLRTHMMSVSGGFYTAQDAIVGDIEGASYLWSHSQIDEVLGGDATRFFGVYSLSLLPGDISLMDPDGAPGVLRVLPSARDGGDDIERRIASVDAQRRKLLTARGTRAQPARDEKMLVGLNGLAIEGLVASARFLGKSNDINLAKRAATEIWHLAWDAKTRRLSHQIYNGRARGAGFLDDYALFGRALLSIYSATHEKIWLQRAGVLADALLRDFDPKADGALHYAAFSDTLIFAPLEQGDEAYPSGVSAAVDLLLELAKAAGNKRYAQAATRIAQQAPGPPERWPLLVAAVNSYPVLSAAPAVARHTKAASKPAEDTAAHVRASGVAHRSAEHDEILVLLEIEEGFHINANPASFDFLIPTTLRVPAIPGVEVHYPQATAFKSSIAPDALNVYQGTVQLAARLQKGTFDQIQAVRATIAAQACTETVCLPPSEIPLTIRVEGPR